MTEDYALDKSGLRPRIVPDFKFTQVRDSKMTIALGLKAVDGLVLCTDSQITKAGGLKYEAPKIFPFLDDDWAAALAFAGNPDFMKLVFETLSDRLHDPTDSELRHQFPDRVRIILKDILRTLKREHPKMMLEILCACSHKREGFGFLVTKNNLVAPAAAECLGVGDSSIIQFLFELFRPLQILSLKQATMLCVYGVEQAKKYIDGCGGETQLICIDKKGHMDISFHMPEIRRILSLVEMEFTILLHKATQEEKEGSLQRANEAGRNIVKILNKTTRNLTFRT
jgi:20S proteasome alpha/beta subunit